MKDFSVNFTYYFAPMHVDLEVKASGHYTPGRSGNDPDADNEIEEITVTIHNKATDDVEEIIPTNVSVQMMTPDHKWVWVSLYDLLYPEVWDRVA